jgi:Ca2+/Na+ antiporter
MSEKTKDKSGIGIGIIIVALVIVTLFFYLMNADIGVGEISMGGIVLIIVVFAIYVIWDRVRSARAGLPVKDEMEKKISWRAGYYGFIAAIWSAVFGPTIIDILFGYELEGSRVSALVVLVACITFVLSYLYFRRKGIKD